METIEKDVRVTELSIGDVNYMKSPFENPHFTVSQIMLLKLLLERVERNIKRLFEQDPYNNFIRIEGLKFQRECYSQNLTMF